MLRRTPLAAMCLGLLVAALADGALAQEGEAVMVRTGAIRNVDLKARTFELKRGARVMNFGFTSTTVFTIDSQTATAGATLKNGAQASVTYGHGEFERTASKVEVTTESGSNRATSQPTSRPASQPATRPATRPATQP